MAEHLVGRAGGEHLAAVEHGHGVADAGNQFEVVLDDDVTPSDLRVELAPGASWWGRQSLVAM